MELIYTELLKSKIEIIPILGCQTKKNNWVIKWTVLSKHQVFYVSEMSDAQ